MAGTGDTAKNMCALGYQLLSAEKGKEATGRMTSSRTEHQLLDRQMGLRGPLTRPAQEASHAQEQLWQRPGGRLAFSGDSSQKEAKPCGSRVWPP